jgi:predicted RNase H-like HicB family nuclease
MPTSNRTTVPVVLSRAPDTGAYEAKCVTLRECVGRGATEAEAMERLKEHAREVLANRKACDAPMFDEARVIFMEIALDDE